MYLSERDFQMRQEQYQTLLEAAERERLIRAAGLHPPSLWDLSRSVVNQPWIRLAVRYPRPQPSVQALPVCSDPCC